MKKLSSKDLQTFLKSNMGFRAYTLDEVYGVYTDLLNRDLFLKYELMQKQSFRRKLRCFADVEGTWLVIDRPGKKTMYRVVEPEPCCKYSELHDKAIKLYNHTIGYVICQK